MTTYKQIKEYSEGVALMIDALCEEIKYDYVCEHTRESLQRLFANEYFICIGAYKGDKLIGVIGFIVFPEIYNYNKVVAYEQFWYVLPDYRKGVGLGLVKYIEKTLKSDIIEFGVSQPRLQKLLKLNGYDYFKSLMRKEL